MTRLTTWLTVLAMALATACTPRAASRESLPEESRDAQQRKARRRAYYAGIPEAVDEMLPAIRRHVQALAALGPRQTGQAGCDAALAYIRSALKAAAPDCPQKTFSSTVTVPLDRLSQDELELISSGGREFTNILVEGLPGRARAFPAYALMPNCVQSCATHPAQRCPLREEGKPGPFCRNCERPRRLVDLGAGRWRDFAGKDLDGAVVLLDFNSLDAWLRAASLGAAGAIFIEPDQTTVFQADKKYLATVPLHFPRLYVRRPVGQQLRQALAKGAPLRVTMRNRLQLRNVPARCVELTIPGKDRSYCYVLAGHFDARCIVPDLAYGGAELWGIAELIELTRYLAANRPNCDVRVIFVSGHWQSQQAMRDYLARDGANHELVGNYFKMAMGIDLVPEGRSINLITESMWDVQGRGMYKWLGNRLFNEGGWREQIFEGLELPADEVELYGGVRPTLSETQDGAMANRNDRSAFAYAPRYPTAEEAFQALGLTSFAFQTSRLTRLAHNTPLDRLKLAEARSIDDQLRPQLKMTLAVLRHLLDFPRKRLPRDRKPGTRRGRSWGGYAQITGRILQWDQSIGWFAERLPGDSRGKVRPQGGATAPGDKKGRALKTFIYAYPADARFTRRQGARLRNYIQWPMCPFRGQHRELQSFMFQDLRLLEHSHFRINTIYAAYPETQYDVIAYSLDAGNRICWTTDYGIHGDGNKAFQCTDLDIVGANVYVPVSMFRCGALELFNLIDPQRYNPNTYVFGAWYHHYGYQNVDGGVPPHLRVSEVKNVESHTDMERWSFVQYGPTAMVFLPADARTGAEVLLGGFFTDIAVLNNPGPDGKPRGYRVHAGQTLRLTSAKRPTPLVCLEQLASLNDQRLKEFARHDVASPLAKRYHQSSARTVELGREAQARGDYRTALAHYMRGWIFESQAYRDTLKLLLDVVATTVLYFVLLIPFSFLIERLVFPQRTVLRTALVAAAVFATFAFLLYWFHPGFKLAHNVVVTTTAFVIVVMTIPALILLLLRGVAMLRAIGSKRVITQRSEAESAGVVMAALSLAVSNMRRRRLRTGLTLLTITALVMALVLLTTSSAFDFRILEPSGAGRASFEGIQIYNAKDRRHPLLTEIVEIYEAALADEALVLRREGVNYGYNPNIPHNGGIFLEANGRRVVLPYFQVMDHRDNLIEYSFTDTVDERLLRFLGALAGGLDGSEAGRLSLNDLLVGDNAAGHKALVASALEKAYGKGTPAGQALHELFATERALPLAELLGRLRAGRRTLHLADLMQEVNPAGRFLAPGDLDVCLLPNNMAEALGVDVGDTVTFMGLPLKVKGIFRARTQKTEHGKTIFVPGTLDRLTDLDGLPITTMRGAYFRQGEADNPIHAPSSEVVIVPRSWIRRHAIMPSVVHSLVVIPRGKEDKGKKITSLAARLATEILNVDVFSHYADPKMGVVAQRISMHTATHVKGSNMMLVILAVAVLMILAIMTGTVHERMREIHIFSSVGLSPRHVAGMFFVEALVYAGIAAVLGYFIGIIALKGLLAYLKSTGQGAEFYPNYLGVFVLYSIGMAVLATVASAVYPIRLASRIVNPSEGRSWKIHQAEAEDDRWHVLLPFIATTWAEAQAMMVYAYDYLVIHQGERSGRFVCQQPPVGRRTERTLHLQMPVWLAPFERNLTQDSELSAVPADDADWWVLKLDLRRTSGPPYLWRRGATVFVDQLCKHLLRWRAATAEQEADCLSRADAVFAAGR